jgi:hypothetical protein
MTTPKKPRKPRTPPKPFTVAERKAAEGKIFVKASMRQARKVELDALRAEVKRKQRNAAAKIRRLEKNKGVAIKLSHADPRANAAKIARYTAKQLIAHAVRLDEFTNRKTQYVPGVEGTPISAAKWKEYKTLEQAVNEAALFRDNERKHIKDVAGTMTLGERKATFYDDRISAAGDAVFDFMPKTTRKSFQMADEKALEKFIKLQKSRLDGNYIPGKIKEARGQMAQMLKEIGNTEFIERAKKLTDYQFDLLWQDASNVNQISLVYWITQQMARGTHERQFAKQLEDNTSDIHDLFAWAEKQPKTSRGSKEVKG